MRKPCDNCICSRCTANGCKMSKCVSCTDKTINAIDSCTSEDCTVAQSI